MKVLMDVNVLLRLNDKNSPDHPVCVAAVRRLTAAGDDLCICTTVMCEYWVAGTRPIEVNGWGMKPKDAAADLRQAMVSFTYSADPPDLGNRWLGLVERHEVAGKTAHDARLVALMLANGIATVLTLNPSDFTRYDEITTLHPKDVR